MLVIWRAKCQPWLTCTYARTHYSHSGCTYDVRSVQEYNHFDGAFMCGVVRADAAMSGTAEQIYFCLRVIIVRPKMNRTPNVNNTVCVTIVCCVRTCTAADSNDIVVFECEHTHTEKRLNGIHRTNKKKLCKKSHHQREECCISIQFSQFQTEINDKSSPVIGNKTQTTNHPHVLFL